MYFLTSYRIYEPIVKKSEKGVSCAGCEEAVGRSTCGMKDSLSNIALRTLNECVKMIKKILKEWTINRKNNWRGE